MAQKPLRIAEGETGRALPRKITFTVAALERIAPPSTGRLWVYDTRQPGLCLMITEKNARAFYVYRKFQGRPVRGRVGGFDELSIEQARKLAAGHMLQFAAGINPFAPRRAAGAALTLGDAWTHFYENHALKHLRDAAGCLNRWDVHLSRWKARRLDEIDRSDVLKLQARIGAMNVVATVDRDGKKYKGRRGGKGTANRTIALLSSIYGLAMRELDYRGDNPAQRVRKFKETSRERYLTPDELGRFHKALATFADQDVADYFRMALMTGARAANLKSMKWSDLNLSEGVWQISAAEFKNAQAQRVSLTPEAVDILRARESKAKGPWVFPSPASASGHLENPYKRWRDLCDAAELKDIRPHDLRRTLAVFSLAGGASAPAVSKMLGHRSLTASAVYGRLDLAPVRQALGQAGDAMRAALTPKEAHEPAKPAETEGGQAKE